GRQRHNPHRIEVHRAATETDRFTTAAGTGAWRAPAARSETGRSDADRLAVAAPEWAHPFPVGGTTVYRAVDGG
ncbi:MAG: hypothetical protein ACRDRU_07085, partial [Pseudonocardiaceae bacterium]